MRTNASVSNEHTCDRTRAIATLCRQLNATATRYPGTQLVLSYEVKDHPGTLGCRNILTLDRTGVNN